jgi:hypothetical protein
VYIEQAILTELTTYSALTALVSTRIYYVKAPQNVTEPYIVFFKVSAPREHTYDGAAGMVNARFQFSIFSETYYEAKQIAEQLQAALQGKHEIIGTAPGVYAAITYDNETDMYETETGLYHIACDYTVMHSE